MPTSDVSAGDQVMHDRIRETTALLQSFGSRALATDLQVRLAEVLPRITEAVASRDSEALRKAKAELVMLDASRFGGIADDASVPLEPPLRERVNDLIHRLTAFGADDNPALDTSDGPGQGRPGDDTP